MISLLQVFMFFPSNNNLLYFPIGKQDSAIHCFFVQYADVSYLFSMYRYGHRRPNLRMNDQVLRVFNGFYKQIYSQPKLF
jgi:hypothetical protein